MLTTSFPHGSKICGGCGREEDYVKVKATWLEPVFVDTGRNTYNQIALCPSCAKWKLRYWIKVAFKLRIGRRLSDWLAPGWGHCARCGTNWHFVDGHSTMIHGGGGMFPLCVHCWGELTPEQRLPFYKKVFESWEEPRDFRWEVIEEAVLSEPPIDRVTVGFEPPPHGRRPGGLQYPRRCDSRDDQAC